jgi:hypothetical protein
MSHLVSMVVRNLDVVGIRVDEPETDAPLVVDGDRMLSLPVSLKFVESVAGRDLQVLEARSQAHVLQLARRPLGNLLWKPFRLARRVQLLCVPVRERLDHRPKRNLSRDACQPVAEDRWDEAAGLSLDVVA